MAVVINDYYQANTPIDQLKIGDYFNYLADDAPSNSNEFWLVVGVEALDVNKKVQVVKSILDLTNMKVVTWNDMFPYKLGKEYFVQKYTSTSLTMGMSLPNTVQRDKNAIIPGNLVFINTDTCMVVNDISTAKQKITKILEATVTKKIVSRKVLTSIMDADSTDDNYDVDDGVSIIPTTDNTSDDNYDVDDTTSSTDTSSSSDDNYDVDDYNYDVEDDVSIIVDDEDTSTSEESNDNTMTDDTTDSTKAKDQALVFDVLYFSDYHIRTHNTDAIGSTGLNIIGFSTDTVEITFT